MAISLAVDTQQKSTMAVFLTDALSVLQALTNNKLPQLAKALQLLSNNCSGPSVDTRPVRCSWK